MIQIYALTPVGQSLSHSVRNPITAEWKIIHYLAKVGRSTGDQIRTYCGLGNAEATRALVTLRHKRVIEEETGTEV